MYDLNTFSLTNMTDCSAALRKLGLGATCMEEAAQRVVDYLYEHLRDGPAGPPATVLLRMFKTHAYGELDEDLREFARGVLGDPNPPAEMKCLTLLASAGPRTEWQSRDYSEGHKAIPLPSVELVRQFPMISNLVKQFGLEITSLLNPDPSCLGDLEKTTYNVFHVPESLGSPYVPAQEDFVIPCGVRTTLGFGGLLPGGNLFAVILFARVAIPRETADLFKPMALAVEAALLPFSRAVFREVAHQGPARE